MKRSYGLLMLTVVLTVVLAACTANEPAEMTEAERAEIRAAVENQLQVMSDAFDRQDFDEAVSVYAQDAVLIDFANRYTGIEAIREHTANLRGRFQSWEGSHAPFEVTVLSREWASFVVQNTTRRQDSDGLWFETNPYVYFSGLFHQTDGEWKIAFRHVSGSFRQVEEPAEE